MARVRRRFGTCVWLGLLLLVTDPAGAQEDVATYPSRPIHIVVGFSAGGGNDVIARMFGQKLSESLGQPVIVENRLGASSIVATEYVAKSPPDGYTLLVGASSMAINPAVYAHLPYDTLRDFTAVSELASFPLIMVVNGTSPLKSVADLVAFAKANPDKANYASSSASFQLVTELFKQKTGAPMQVIPYKGANDSVLAVVSGEVTTAIADPGPVSGQVRAGTARALAVAAPQRMADFPDVPTMKEAGVDLDAALWSGVFVPKATPAAIAGKLEAEFMRIAKLPDIVARLRLLNVESVGSSSSDFTAIMAADTARWAEVAKSAHIKFEQ